MFVQPLSRQHVQRLYGEGTAFAKTAKALTMQGAVLLVAISTVKQSLGCDHRPHGALATAQCFGKRDNVRHDILILESAEPACASSTDLYLVEYRKDVVLPAQPGEFCQEARWRHFACRAAYRLYECGDYSVGAVPRRLCFEIGRAHV